mgnify:CR=1 FL=1
MATAYIREYADIAVTFSKYVQAGAEPAITDQTVTTSASSAQSAAFNANTRLIAISTPAAQAVCAVFGDNPTAATSNLRLPANNMFFFGAKPGQKVALIDVA